MTETGNDEKEKNQSIIQNDASNIDWQKEVNDWGLLITKHPLRFKIWTILNLYGALNVTQISKFVKESKSTVSRIGSEMEIDHLLESSTEQESKIKGRIASKNYKISSKESLMKNLKPRTVPKDPKGRIQYYRDRITEDRSAIRVISDSLAMLHPLLNEFEKKLNKLENLDSKKLNDQIVDKADKFYTTYFQGELEPMYFFKYQSKRGYNLQEELWSNFSDNQSEELKKENNNPVKDFASYSIKIPMKALFEFHEKKEKKKS